MASKKINSSDGLTTAELDALEAEMGSGLTASQLDALEAEHAKKKPTPARGADTADLIAANPLTRFALGASAPIRGIFEALPDQLGGADWRERNARIAEMVARGKAAQPDVVSGVGSTADFVGEALSPVFLGVQKYMGPIKKGADLIKQGAVIGGTAGLTAPDGSDGGIDRLTHGAVGAVLGGTLAPVASTLLRGAVNTVLPIVSKSAAEAAAARIANKAAGERDVALALRNANPGETASQAALPAGSSEFIALQPFVEGRNATEFGNVARTQAAQRMAELQRITPDMVQAKAARSAGTAPLYQQASATQVPFDPTLSSLVGRMPPGVVSSAINNLRTRKMDFLTGQYGPKFGQYPEISGEGLHQLKLGLSDIVNALDDSGVATSDRQAAGALLSELLAAIDTRIPEYTKARSEFARLSKPIDQANVLHRMAAILEKPGGGERVTQFLNVLGMGEEALLKKTTGAPRYEQGDLQKVLTPNQYEVVLKIAEKLKAGADISAREHDGLQAAARALKTAESRGIRGPHTLHPAAVTGNWVLKMMEEFVGGTTENALSNLMLPQNVQRLGGLMQIQKSDPFGFAGKVVRNQGAPLQEYFNALSPKHKRAGGLASVR